MSRARELSTIGIANTNTVKINHTDVTDDEYARFTAGGLESMTTAEVLADLDQNLSDFVVTHTLPSTAGTSGQFLKLSDNSGQTVWDDIFVPTYGILNQNTVKIDMVGVANTDYAKFTANGLEGRDYSQVKTDLSLNNVENTALSTWGGSTAIVTVGALTSGSINWTGTINTGSGAITTTGSVTGGVVNASTTLQIGGTDVTTMFATATQGSTADSAIQPSTSPTLTNLTLAGSAGAGYLRGPATLTIDPSPHDDIAGTVIVKGSLQVDGTTTTINSTTKSIADLDMVLASGATNSAQSDSAGIIVGNFSGNPSILYTDSTTSWDFNKNIITTGTITASGGNSTNWNSAYTTSTTAILDADFASNGLMARSGSGTYTIVTDSSSNWNTAYGWGDHSTQGYLTASSSATLTNKGGNISQWTNDSGYISTANYVPISSPTFTGDVTVQSTSPNVILDDTDANSVYAATGSIQFKGKDSGGNSTEYARIMGQIGNNVTDGQEEGRLYFGRVTSGGSSPTNVMWLQEQDIGLGDEQTITWYNHKGTTHECVLDWATPSAANTITFPDASGTVALLDSNADLSFGDNDKAIFGANSDLKIYSDGGGAVFETQGQTMDAFRFTKVNDSSVGAFLFLDHQSSTPSTVDFTSAISFNRTDTTTSTTTNVALWMINMLTTKFNQMNSAGSVVTYLTLDGQNDKITFGYPVHGDGSNLTGIIPSQTSNSGKFLTTDGSSTSWGAVEALPSQTSNSGKFLTTDGSSASWATIDLSSYLTTSSASSTYAPLSGANFTGDSSVSGDFSVGTNATNYVDTMANADADNFFIFGTGNYVNAGMTIRTNTNGRGCIHFSDYTNGVTSNVRAGSIQYNHQDDAMYFGANGYGNTFLVLGDSTEYGGITNGVQSTSICTNIVNIRGQNTVSDIELRLQTYNWSNSQKIYITFGEGWGSWTEQARIEYNGGVTAKNIYWKWGTTTRYEMDSSGNFRADGNITAYYSDERLKDFHGKIENALDKVKNINGYYYSENEKAKEFGFNDQDKKQVGISAQEIEKVLPEVVSLAPFDSSDGEERVSKSGENYKTVDYAKIVPLLIEAIKEQQDRIEVLESHLQRIEIDGFTK